MSVLSNEIFGFSGQEDLTKLHVKHSQDLGISDCSPLSLPQALLEEKNQEIDHLNEQMKRLQHELQKALENKVRVLTMCSLLDFWGKQGVQILIVNEICLIILLVEIIWRSYQLKCAVLPAVKCVI